MEHIHLTQSEMPLVAGFRIQCSPMVVKIHCANTGTTGMNYSLLDLNELDARAHECEECNAAVNSFVSEIRNHRKARGGSCKTLVKHMHFVFDLGKIDEKNIIAGSKTIAHLIISVFVHNPKTKELGLRIFKITIMKNNIIRITANLVGKDESEGFVEIRRKILEAMKKFFE